MDTPNGSNLKPIILIPNMYFYEYSKPYLKQVEDDMQRLLAVERKDVYGMIYPFIKRGGKRVRPLLAAVCCAAVGGNPKHVIRPAAIIELFHNFTLIHDDIEDNSDFRRGKPTMHITYGIPIALNAGDALYTLVWNKLADLDMPAKQLIELQKLYVTAFKNVVDGQGIELNWYKTDRFDIKQEEYFHMINGKTAALIGLSCEIGAFFGNANSKTRNSLRNFGEKIGAAFQIHDDILNVTGNFEKYQKEIGGDISEGKRSLMIVHLLAHASEQEKKKVITILKSHSKKKQDISSVIELLKNYGSIESATETATRLVNEAKSELDFLKSGNEKKALLSLADFVVERES